MALLYYQQYKCMNQSKIIVYITECTKWHLLFCCFFPTQWRNAGLLLVGQMVTMCCDTQAQCCRVIKELNCKKLEAIKCYQKKKNPKGLEMQCVGF